MNRAPLKVTPREPTHREQRGAAMFFDFGNAVWSGLQIELARVPASDFVVRLGEKLNANGDIDRHPPGSVNYLEIRVSPQAGRHRYGIEIPSRPEHAVAGAVRMPETIGEVTPFRYVEVESTPDAVSGAQPAFEIARLQQLFVHAEFDDNASRFHCSDDTLNAVWELCRHTMKATTAFGVYIDGERERIAYEADAYINQLSHLACDFNPVMARASIAHLLEYPTWPTEWSFHTIMMVAADYEATGDKDFVARFYEQLPAKLLMTQARADGLLCAGGIVDWPATERDDYNGGARIEGDRRGHVGPEFNTVVNAFYFHALQKMAVLAAALECESDRRHFEEMAARVHAAFNRHFFDADRALYTDGVNRDNEPVPHASFHANLFALAFGLVPPERVERIADFLESRGMACSVYGAQYLLETLYRAGRDESALRLMTSHGERSWWQMIEAGSTMTWEAWNETVKKNLTWNHAWGAAPLNIITRYLLGVRPQEAGYSKVLIAPRPAFLRWADAVVPTARGPIHIRFRNEDDFQLDLTLPDGMSAQVQSPRAADRSTLLTAGSHQLRF